MKASEEPIDYEELGEKLHEALKAEALYSLQNDAKFRAIEQAVPTYEDFSQMVKAAHLQPLHRKDMIPKVGVKWNCIANNDANTQIINQRLKLNNQLSSVKISTKTIPTSSHEFRQVWKGFVDHTDKFRLLHESRHTLCGNIFRSEIPSDLLTDCLVTCLERLKLHKSENDVIDILSTLSGCNRFKLAIKFMTKGEKNICEEVFQSLRQTVKTSEDIVDNLEKKYLL